MSTSLRTRLSSLNYAASALILLLAGCVSGADHVPPQMPLPAKFEEGGSKSNGKVVTAEWWTAYRDKRLDGLVTHGLRENLDVEQALENINAASANVTVAGAGGLPSLTVGPSHTLSGEKGRLRTSVGTTNTTGGEASLSWLLDFFGQYRRSRESAIASLGAAYATADNAKLTFLKDLVESYIDARYYQERIALSKGSLKSRQQTYELTQLQVKAGAASRLDVVQAEGLVQSTKSEIPGLQQSFTDSAHHIATLIGMPASSLMGELQKSAGQPVFRGDIRAGIPADLIRSRPDIRKAERELAAAVADIGAAEAQLYPSITLSGSISPSWVKSSGASGGSLTSWSFGPSLNLPIFDGGTLRANVEIEKSDARTQYLAWKAAVLNGVEEVENALTAVRRDTQTLQPLRRQVQTAQESLALSTTSYKDGASSLLDVLDAQRSVSDAEASLAATVQQVAKDYVDLYVAIGAGYLDPKQGAAKPTAKSG
ncbi:efflux transporter outer membrane subunit [Rhizobium lentis]|uniref:NodT family efflux transporter outer membrane factor (OMF) lipoprotein n=1 Tax=Rhizobium lentis TaxID=1138194 RepID=A0A7W8XGM9_9HYPH|nr:efflux transporter outer membrane subunit [Rhizobium lentis]MBB4575936.1 NodT family efflux transporter outer membrane factor (OMF) lipoprotein [Rhizobium lentis]MBB5552001.1 NodT family efflux transporter outer membrane factor (OMF) lipoprotein [Rhizobium lentis]MBB5562539.1 NodT family efflux transporter outer membrane factor (OMF) lipoprotein [Rhizobium lentis]MBB5569914.1 NodT family efflux transporter outer membrane factor (OMF) lipoprotein [Rhizobium lentis]